MPRNLLIKWVEKRNNNEINHKQRNKNKNKNEENIVKRLASNNFLLKSNKSLWRAYGTNTELYSCSKQITHKSGINLSFLVPSNPLSALPFEPENEVMTHIERKQKYQNAKDRELPSLSCPCLLAAASRTLH